MSIAAMKTSYEQILMLLENEPYPGDTRVRREAESLVRAGHAVTVIAPRQGEQPGREEIAGVSVVRYDLVQSNGTARGYVAEYAIAHLRLLVETLRGIRRGATVVARSVADPRAYVHILRLIHYYNYSHVQPRRRMRLGELVRLARMYLLSTAIA